MKYLDLSFKTPEENLACDEALLEQAEEGLEGEILRFWESASYFVVLGYSKKLREEVDQKSCERLQIPIYRRTSGGGTVLQGPGCLNYSLVLNTENSRPIKTITETNHYVLNQHKKFLEAALNQTISVEGISDLASDSLKFSGNAQRRKKSFVLFHGTFLLDFQISLIKEVLALPSDQPDYRNKRTHEEFLMNLKVPSKIIKETLLKSWNAKEVLNQIPEEQMKQLVKEKYSRQEWNFKY